jgi:poly(3-hydroxybutyrate) depolymerase
MTAISKWIRILVLGLGGLLAVTCGDDSKDDTSDTASQDDDQITRPDDSDSDPGDGTLSDDEQDATDSGGEGDSTSSSDSTVTEVSCEDLKEGANVGFVVGSFKRTVTINFPQNVESAGPWPVIFGWHGVGDTDENFSQFLSWLVDNKDYPFISVTPDDRNLIPPVGFEWAYFKGVEGNADIELFDALVECLDQRFGVDRDRIHTFGLSGGAIMSDFLAAMRGDELASVLTYSGGYFSNPNNPSSALIKGMFSWPATTPTSSYAQVLIHGGPTDSYSLLIDTIHFDQMTLADVPYLNGLGHDVLLCNHGLGHPVIPAELSAEEMVKFFADHPRTAVDSPYASTPPDWLPDYCELKLKTP